HSGHSKLFRRDFLASPLGAEKAYYVRCGQGVTMTANDVQQGRMIIEIGMATVRPAEFVVMKIVLQNR
ncbi:MAG: hypothetical protein AAFP02_10170, partial [Bacteroidota bacterium]